MGLAILPLALGTFVAANQAALRSRRDRAEELLDTLPQDARTRTGAQLLAVLAALPIAVCAARRAPTCCSGRRTDSSSAPWDAPRAAVVELLQGPLLVLALGALGVLLGRIAPVTPLALLLVVAIVFVEVAARGLDARHRVALGRAAREQRHRRARMAGPSASRG